MSKSNGTEAMMARLLESQIQLAQNQILMDTRHQETMAKLDERFAQIDATFIQIDERLTRVEQKLDALPDEVFRRQAGFTAQTQP